MILAGIDEAGYGPMLGPLVVSVAVFRAPNDEDSFWKLLRPLVGKKPKPRTIPVADSKKLFNQKKGLINLEEGLLPFLTLPDGEPPSTLRQLLKQVARRGRDAATDYLDAYPWYRDADLDLPRDSYSSYIKTLSKRLGERCEKADIEFIGLASIPLEVLEFNSQLGPQKNKANVSFLALGSFLRRLWKRFPDEDVHLFVDRQGGRIQYGERLFQAVKPRGVQILEESPERSSYFLTRRGAAEASFQVSFSMDCEDKHLPVALASMLSKYLRELHMQLFNQYWSERQSDLKPTAGYVQDARRFLADTQSIREELGVSDRLLIRQR